MPTYLPPVRAADLGSARARLAVVISILDGVALSTCITRLSAIEQRIYDEVYA